MAQASSVLYLCSVRRCTLGFHWTPLAVRALCHLGEGLPSSGSPADFHHLFCAHAGRSKKRSALFRWQGGREVAPSSALSSVLEAERPDSGTIRALPWCDLPKRRTTIPASTTVDHTQRRVRVVMRSVVDRERARRQQNRRCRAQPRSTQVCPEDGRALPASEKARSASSLAGRGQRAAACPEGRGCVGATDVSTRVSSADDEGKPTREKIRA